jgi:hypothetical protein
LDCIKYDPPSGIDDAYVKEKGNLILAKLSKGSKKK